MFFTSGQSNSTSGHVHRPRNRRMAAGRNRFFSALVMQSFSRRGNSSTSFFGLPFVSLFVACSPPVPSLPFSRSLALRRGQRNLFFELSKWRCSKETPLLGRSAICIEAKSTRVSSDDDDGTVPFAITDSSTSRSKLRGKERGYVDLSVKCRSCIFGEI